MLIAGNADGDLVPPMTLHKSGTGSVYQSWCEGGPDGATYAATKNGWFDADKFNQWVKQVPVTVEFLSYKKSGSNLSAQTRPDLDPT